MKLQQALNMYNKKTLLNIAKVYSLKGGYKLRKAELCDALAGAMCHSLYKGLEKLSLEDYQCFERLVKIEQKKVEVEELSSYRVLFALGLIYLWDGDKVQVAPELKEAFNQMMKDENVKKAFKEKQAISQKVTTYMQAAMNLYGMMPIEDFLEFYTQYEEVESLEKEEIYPILEAIYTESVIYGDGFIEDGYLMDGSFEYVSAEEIMYFKKETQSKPYYRPEKAIFLRYADEYYYEETSEIKEVKRFLNHRFPFHHQDIEEAVEDWVLDTCIEIMPSVQLISELLVSLENYGLVLSDFKEVQQFTQLMQKAHNHTRMWINRGYSPQELREIMGAQKARVKVGRNDPCPCGSGKKYKKCCGNKE